MAKQIAWIEWLKSKSGKSLAALARDAGRSHNLLTRKLAEGGLLSTSTIELLMESTGLPGPDTYLLPSSAAFSDEASAYETGAKDNDPVTARLVEQALKGRPNATSWRLRTRALEGAGYLSGDIVIADAAEIPTAGDAVCASVYDMKSGTAETVFRLYEPPYLISASTESTLRKPLLIDNERVIVVGAITQSFRSRRRQ